MRDVAYSLLPEELKVKLHRAAATHYEQLLHDQAGQRSDSIVREGSTSSKKRGNDLVNILAQHWKHAGQSAEAVAKAVDYLTMAGDQALAKFAIKEAKLLHEEALERARRSELQVAIDARGPLERRLGQSLQGIGQFERCREMLESALISLDGEPAGRRLSDLSEAQLSRKERLQHAKHLYVSLCARPPQQPSVDGAGSVASAMSSSAANSGGDDALAASATARVLALEKRRAELAVAYELLVKVAMHEHLTAQAGYCAMRALNIGLSLRVLHPVVARAYASLCLVAAAAASPRVEMYKQKALQACRSEGAEGGLGQLAYALLAAGIHNAGFARWRDAQSNFESAAEISADLRDKRQWEEAVAHRAHLEFYRGNFSESKRLYEKARSSGKERGDKNMLNRCNAGIAGILLATNALQGALDLLRETNSYGQLALCYLRKGERQQALEKALQTKDRFKGKRTKYYVLKGFTSTAEVILKLLEDAILRRRRTDALSSTQSLSVAPDGSPAGRSRRNSLTRANSRVSRAVASRLTKVGRQSTAIGDAASGGRGVQVGDLTKLQEIAEEWIEKLSQFSNVYAVAKPRALLMRGQLLLLYERRKGGMKSLRKARELARKLEMPYEEGLAMYELGKHTANSAEAGRLFSGALDRFVDAGALYDVERCRHRIGSRAASLHNHGSTTFFGSTSAHLSPGNVGSLRGTEGEEEGEGEVPWDEEPPGRASPSAVSPTVAGSDA